ncbi:hypothetical protein [Azospirillum tabaci]|uniref:hypothetical protein n=1 Tax=Azospirillum tabaci TaxID=2752310 RepID=UPI001FEB049A|nr:hypothetical protein [Azospirillum tabaci]
MPRSLLPRSPARAALFAVAAMIGAAFILTDPIFQGLAISLLFGLFSSTLLMVLAIPAICIVLRGNAADHRDRSNIQG